MESWSETYRKQWPVHLQLNIILSLEALSNISLANILLQNKKLSI